MSFQATTVVSFNDGSSDADYVFEVELDDKRNLDSEGNTKTSFSPGDNIYVQVNKSYNVDIIDVVATAGTVTPEGAEYRDEVVYNLFTARPDTREEEFVLTHIPNASAFSFVGRSGQLERSVTNIMQHKFTPDTSKTPFMAKIQYSYKILSYLWKSPEVEIEENGSYEMALVFYIKVR